MWSIKVGNANVILDNWLIRGLETAAENGDVLEVANVSIGREGFDGSRASEALYQAVRDAVNPGVTVAVAAGHDDDSSGGSSAAKPRATYTVSPGISISPRSGAVNTTVKVTLRGLAAGETITVKWFTNASPSTQTIKSTLVASSSGSASFSFKVPAATGGSHKIEATGSTGSHAATTFNVTASITPVAPTATPTETEPARSPTPEPSATAEPSSTETTPPEPTPTLEPTDSPAETATPTPEPAETAAAEVAANASPGAEDAAS